MSPYMLLPYLLNTYRGAIYQVWCVCGRTTFLFVGATLWVMDSTWVCDPVKGWSCCPQHEPLQINKLREAKDE